MLNKFLASGTDEKLEPPENYINVETEIRT